MKSCDYGDCSENRVNISRLSPEGFLVATGNKAYSFRELTKGFIIANYIMNY